VSEPGDDVRTPRVNVRVCARVSGENDCAAVVWFRNVCDQWEIAIWTWIRICLLWIWIWIWIWLGLDACSGGLRKQQQQ